LGDSFDGANVRIRTFQDVLQLSQLHRSKVSILDVKLRQLLCLFVHI
jgi:hypothetical protein